MGRTTVTAPDGARWEVGRRWMDREAPKPWSAWRRRRRKRDDADRAGDTDWIDAVRFVGDGDDLLVLVAFAVAAAVVVALFAFVILPLLGLALELALLVAFFGSGLFGRLVLRHPWTIEAVAVEPPRRVRGQGLAPLAPRDRRAGAGDRDDRPAGRAAGGGGAAGRRVGALRSSARRAHARCGPPERRREHNRRRRLARSAQWQRM